MVDCSLIHVLYSSGRLCMCGLQGRKELLIVDHLNCLCSVAIFKYLLSVFYQESTIVTDASCFFPNACIIGSQACWGCPARYEVKYSVVLCITLSPLPLLIFHGVCCTPHTTQGLVSLLFSFMVIWDLPNLRRGVQALKTSRLGFAYNTIAPQVSKWQRAEDRAQRDDVCVRSQALGLRSQVSGLGGELYVLARCSERRSTMMKDLTH